MTAKPSSTAGVTALGRVAWKARQWVISWAGVCCGSVCVNSAQVAFGDCAVAGSAKLADSTTHFSHFIVTSRGWARGACGAR